MDLMWWPVVPAGLACLAGCVAVALLLPERRARRRARPLAHVDRLTRLPEYARLRRRQLVSAATTLTLLVVLFGAAVLAAGRPAGSGRDFDALHPEDIMLCLADPVTDDTSRQFLDYFARQAATFDTQRIGLTTPTVRVLPLTLDHQFAATLLGDPARVAGRVRSVAYSDYAVNLRDTMALCLAGFGVPPSPSGHRRSLIYLGPSTFGAADRGSLVDGAQLTDLATHAGVQINALVPAQITEDARRGDDELAALADRTGGRFVRYQAGRGDPVPAGDLDLVRDNPAPVVLPGGARITGQRPDDPTGPLIVALAAGTLLCLGLAVVRR